MSAGTQAADGMQELSSSKLEEALKNDEGAVVFLVLGATEAHGPHLPLATDTIIGEHLARVAATRLREETGARVLFGPSFLTTAATCASGFAGTVSYPGDLERSALLSMLRSFLDAGARRICLLTLHFDPDHLRAVQEALESLGPEARRRVAFPDFTMKENAKRIGGEFATGDCHAGSFETSLMLAAEPRLVDESHKRLPSRKVGLVKGIREGKRSFRELGMHEAYCGDPAHATREEGERLFTLLADLVVATCRRTWTF